MSSNGTGDMDPEALIADLENQMQRRALFPLGKAVLVEAAQPVATAAFVTTCIALIIAGQGLDKSGNPHVLAVMNALVYAYLPLGLFGVLLSVAVKTHEGLVGFSSGFILGHILLPTLIGAVVNVVKSGEEGWVVALVSAIIFVSTIAAWSYLCAYPKFLHMRRRAAV